MAASKDNTSWRAVIDIGSNSVRLVIYDVAGRAMLPHYNEKVMAGLGAGLAQSGKLSTDGVVMALKALGRYQAILQGLNVGHVRAVATAAVRRAQDGPDFVKTVKKMTGLEVEIVSGPEEARLSALGVAVGVHQASGIIGDLGGSSLEFCRIENGRVKSGETLMLGPLSVDVENNDADELRHMVRKALKQSGLVKNAGGRFYMVGGAWRALAKLHMDMEDYSPRLLHGYDMNGKDIQAIRILTQKSDPLSREMMTRASRRRVKVLPYASIVLNEVFDIGGFSDVMVSSYGLREGVIADGLLSEEAGDPLLDGIALTAQLKDQRRVFGEALFNWVASAVRPDADLFGEEQLDQRLVAAACLLADSGARYHPDLRAKLAYEHALHGPYASVSHKERAFIATAVGYRYARQFRVGKDVDALLSKTSMRHARCLGAAMRLGAVFSGRSAAVLDQASLTRHADKLALTVKSKHAAMISATVETRLRTLAQLMDREPEIKLA